MKIDKQLERSVIELIKGYKMLNLENKKKTLILIRLTISQLKLALLTQKLNQSEETKVKAYLTVISDEIGVK